MLWNALLPEIWWRTTIYLYPALARQAGRSARELRSLVRLSFSKVAEYPARGAVHLHLVLRADAAGPAELGACPTGACPRC